MRTLFLPLVASVAALGHAGTLLGLDDSAIYRIDAATGAATVAASLAGHGTGDANALAYDATTNTAYFQRNSALWSVSLTSGAFAQTGYTVGDIAAATFSNGKYVYGTGSALMAVDFTKKSPVTLGTYNKGWSFGDIATAADGTLYGSAARSTFRIEGNGAYTALNGAGHNLQLGFVGSSLYGIANGNDTYAKGAIYTVDLGTGLQTNTGVVARLGGSALAIRDAATYQAVPEPAPIAALAVGAIGLLRRRRK